MNVFDGIKLPKTVYEVNSEINGKISVIEVGATRKLSVDGVVQSVNWNSPSAGRQVWGRLVENLYEQAPNLKKVMILGLGGGSSCGGVGKISLRGPCSQKCEFQN